MMNLYKQHNSNQIPDSAALGLNHSGSPGSLGASTSGQRSHITYHPQNTNNNNLETPNYFKALQWNMQGYINNFDELNLLIKERSPCALSLQETHCAYQSIPIIPKSYSGYFCNSPQNITGKQGIALLIKKNIPHLQININSNILTLAVQVNLAIKFTIISIYILPKQTFSRSDLENIVNQIHTPILLCGDVNSWSVLWGSPASNHRGNVIEEFLANSDLMLLNDGSPTHFSTHNTFTHIDISCCSPILYPLTSWNILEDLHNSDHFPIIIHIQISPNKTRTAPILKFKTDLANWDRYKILTNNYLNAIVPSTK